MNQRAETEYVGVFVGAAANGRIMPAAIEKVAGYRRFAVREVAGGSAAIANLIPEAIREQAAVWLIAHHRQDDRTVIVLPVPQELRESTDANEGNSPASVFLEVVGAACEDMRSTAQGRRGSRDSSVFRSLPPRVECWEILRLPLGLDQLLARRPTESAESGLDEARQASQVITEAGRVTEADRQDLLERVADDPDGEAVEARQAFDDKLVGRNEAIATAIGREFGWERPRLDMIPEDLRSLLDPQSVSFLQTSLMVDDFATRIRYRDFDYAIPGSGFWKTIELELNLSVVWLIRMVWQAAATSGPLVPNPSSPPGVTKVLSSPSEHGKQRFVTIDERDKSHPRQLGKLMLGPIEHLLRSADRNELRAKVQACGVVDSEHVWEVEDFLFGRRSEYLPKGIKKLADLRNNHAHTERMQVEAYEEVKQLALGTPGSFLSSLLASILCFKRDVHAYAARQAAGSPLRPVESQG